ncbi:lysosome-associated membrane glycoprotein 3 [Labrus mixtus]|uniref:lysosome-associated membrane glycoprotein 3 n=1 Tax=Labrus mixtus TaxID=508554 RepID=UPI0029C05866|nr:lysosome-associated membrane glycoprotein 3 [Labrus mixtus]
MMLMAQSGGWTLFLLAAVIPSVHLQGNNSSIQLDSSSDLNTEAQIYHSVEEIPPKGVQVQGNSISDQADSDSKVTTEAQIYNSVEEIPLRVAQGNSSSTQPLSDSEEFPSDAQFYRPVLQPSESIPPIGDYMLKTLAGIPCIKAKMGVVFIVIENKTRYLSLEPTSVRTTGYCGIKTAVLCLTLPNNAASLQFVFKKNKTLFSVTKLTAHLTPLPPCNGCRNKTYSGVMAHEELFTTATGQSFKCNSETLFLMSSQLNIKLVPLQVQAFTLNKGEFGKDVECWADYNKRVIPIIIGAVVVCIILIVVITFLIVRDRRTEGYNSL